MATGGRGGDEGAGRGGGSTVPPQETVTDDDDECQPKNVKIIGMYAFRGQSMPAPRPVNAAHKACKTCWAAKVNVASSYQWCAAHVGQDLPDSKERSRRNTFRSRVESGNFPAQYSRGIKTEPPCFDCWDGRNESRKIGYYCPTHTYTHVQSDEANLTNAVDHNDQQQNIDNNQEEEEEEDKQKEGQQEDKEGEKEDEGHEDARKQKDQEDRPDAQLPAELPRCMRQIDGTVFVTARTLAVVIAILIKELGPKVAQRHDGEVVVKACKREVRRCVARAVTHPAAASSSSSSSSPPPPPPPPPELPDELPKFVLHAHKKVLLPGNALATIVMAKFIKQLAPTFAERHIDHVVAGCEKHLHGWISWAITVSRPREEARVATAAAAAAATTAAAATATAPAPAGPGEVTHPATSSSAAAVVAEQEEEEEEEVVTGPTASSSSSTTAAAAAAEEEEEEVVTGPTASSAAPDPPPEQHRKECDNTKTDDGEQAPRISWAQANVCGESWCTIS